MILCESIWLFLASDERNNDLEVLSTYQKFTPSSTANANPVEEGLLWDLVEVSNNFQGSIHRVI